MLTAGVIREAIERALVEDAPWGDITTEAIFDRSDRAEAAMVARQAGVMAGADVVVATFGVLNVESKTEIIVADGERFVAGQVLAVIETDAHSLLRGERVALNFVQRMCGIATTTRSYVDAVGHTKAKIVDTRKTTPGWRAFEKYAVRSGGATNHRFSLSDAVLVKDNHLAQLARRGLSVEVALRQIRDSAPFTAHIEVEVDRLDQIDVVVGAGVVDSILVDNFDLGDTKRAVELVAGRALVNASGGINSIVQAIAIAETGVDLISIGALTHSAPVVDIGLDMKFS